jgi:hypothetical protein
MLALVYSVLLELKFGTLCIVQSVKQCGEKKIGCVA